VSKPASSVILVFVDGVGVGEADPRINPIFAGKYPALEMLAGGVSPTRDAEWFSADDALYRAIDARLGIDGLPQSGTGQATLFTGVNCAELAGRHYGPFPHSTSKSVIRANNLFSEAESVTGSTPLFANAYPDRFFRYLERTKRWTVTTLCCAAAGVPLLTGSDLRNGRAVSADITGRTWPEAESDHDVITSREAGMRLVRLSEGVRLTVFEYFETDKAGHSRDAGRAAEALGRFNGFLEGILEASRPEQTLVVTSDHGNLEDLSVKTHTLHRVPLLVSGPAARRFDEVQTLVDVKSAIIAALQRGGTPAEDCR
jgi:hypothetical protein